MILLRQSRERTKAPTEVEALGPGIVGPCLKIGVVIKSMRSTEGPPIHSRAKVGIKSIAIDRWTAKTLGGDHLKNSR
ncbi:hypothetical protein TNCV_2011481 [Trichonephila clavipes]|nr:hypothetical protein TNCV_2011481 [Trichonephila clavipes]